MNSYRRAKRIVFFLIVGVFSVTALVSNVSAGQFYPNGYANCVNVNGGVYSGIWSVANYACLKAIEKNQNACATWLGPTNDPTTTEITASAKSGTIDIRYWGMCTDRADESTTIQVTMDNDSIADGNAYNFERSGSWGHPSGRNTTLDIGKFIQGATRMIRNGKETYYRMVLVDRCHSDAGSCGVDLSDIYLVVGESDEPDTPETEESICNTWGNPGSFSASNSLSGVTSIDVRVKNTDSRFGGVGYGAWTDSFVYAKPGDRIAWHTCYYPGVQQTARTSVSEVGNTHVWKGFEELKDDVCMVDPVPVTKQELNLAMTRTPTAGAGSVWQNKYDLSNTMSGGHSITGPLGTQPGSGNFGVGNTEVRWAHNEGDTIKTDGGETYTEYGETGTPKSVAISSYNGGSKKLHGEKGSCYINDNGTNKIKIDGTTYPVCPTTNVTFTDTDNPRKGLVAADAATGAAAYNCWKAITGQATNCNACNGDANCSKNCNTCDGSSCTCEDVDDSYKCLQCENHYSEDIIKATVDENPAKDNASVIIPYNFANYTGVSIESDIVFAGEVVKIGKVWVRVAPRWNSKTIANYATVVPKVEVKFISYVVKSSNGGTSGDKIPGNGSEDLCSIINNRITAQDEKPKQCKELESQTATNLNSAGNLDGVMFQFGGGDYNAFDASAGDSYCVVSAVWPAESLDTEHKGDYNGGDRNWRLSEPDCRPIAKRPSFQVWGGGMYSNKSIDAKTEEKRNVYKAYYNGDYRIGNNFKKTGSTGTIRFGSWIDQGLVINGGITTNVASGASLGKNSNVVQTGNSGGLCDRSVLTFANDRCSNILQGVGNSGIGSGIGNREELINYWISSESGVTGTTPTPCSDISILPSGTSDCKKVNNATGSEIYYASVGNISLGGNISASKTYLIRSSGNVTINNNIRYTDSYSSLGAVPKLIVHTSGNIDITCDVTEVDAILITASNKKVNTCYCPNSTDVCSQINSDSSYDQKERSKQLKIFGMVITDEVELKRTYGGAAWSGSGANGQGEAAEIFDYDSSMMMWSQYMAGSAETDTLQTVYQHELAPRY